MCGLEGQWPRLGDMKPEFELFSFEHPTLGCLGTFQSQAR